MSAFCHRNRAGERLHRVASGYRAHIGVRPLHLGQQSLSLGRRRCDGELTNRNDSSRASRGQLQSVGNGNFPAGRDSAGIARCKCLAADAHVRDRYVRDHVSTTSASATSSMRGNTLMPSCSPPERSSLQDMVGRCETTGLTCFRRSSDHLATLVCDHTTMICDACDQMSSHRSSRISLTGDLCLTKSIR